ncbi:TPA: hypothetical protein DDY55_01640 [Candidatus Falkowbacteria bacterium]|nr:hypothetical protein [Candidatus Falkowbacteria bacterium]HAY12599.1 hypothetical protein [Candidatus Falkowbacteria bacterium]HBI96805.1 hypothetical protein [Candidatus Falkowbacteria bacterium]HBT27860.1 hypothetical protein [Candidatus Falkowbacteria bacterium]HBY14759.1 hypothetical protein [Candidatus Falkowbacteria bacterium]
MKKIIKPKKEKKEKKEKSKFMLSKLFGSTARIKILKLFILHPNEKYYIRQLARDLSLQLNSVRRELENLESFGILTSDISDMEANIEEPSSIEEFLNNGSENKQAKKSNEKIDKTAALKTDKKYYQANTNFVLYHEIKALIMKAQILYEKDFIDKLQSAGSIKLLILTGFFVSNDSSPVDLFMVGRVHKDKLLMHIKELEGELDREINYTIMDFKEYKYRRDITDVFLYGILEGKKVVVVDEYGI